jgi:serine/threonine protein kinase
MKKTVNDPVSFSDPKWINISLPARNLVKSLLKKDPAERMSLEEVLKSEWITNGPNKQRNKEKKERRLSVGSPSSKFIAYT